MLFHQDNALVHKRLVSLRAINNAGCELMDHRPYSLMHCLHNNESIEILCDNQSVLSSLQVIKFDFCIVLDITGGSNK